MGELIVGLVVGYVAASGHGWAHEAALFAGVLLGLVLYAASCAIWPHRPCPLAWMSSHTRTAPGPGKVFRQRRPCRLCGGSYYVRLGSRLMRGG